MGQAGEAFILAQRTVLKASPIVAASARPARGDGLSVCGFEAPQSLLGTEALLPQPVRTLPQSLTLGVLGKSPGGGGPRCSVPRRGQQPRDAVLDRFGKSPDMTGDHRDPRSVGLDDAPGGRLVP